ncbi:N-acetylmuramic acid 6-phosphate etherase [Halanaerobium saccharolyticum]|uniref:N-acetylmuramic acid 6-phosphate etherase n=1 Tax=Halanaerobium saccharolyticum TaxID=43595 RepID=A0A4R7Z2R7_9FIRM|nr:N-acetylmuramic acid 6-phosphate etherase [Halanaerobium saccharolyticum]RAK07867.1 N-acetylmuramic acid 6-phosphate etherase [Halanaerobium saccharolyticum]TDW04481.1 N-acetylmuramic acid 6-phosphate etherase [Halanaerobium saccharolyticum]TDX59817.1 N-acetylmuramic acid 6-phosphate etherase [Halanaerobium saccharolyticum]
MNNDLDKLVTESVNEKSRNIDRVSTEKMIEIINKEDKKVALAVEKEKYKIAEAVDLITTALKNGGRLIYMGAGTSGRLGILDASECPPTYGVSSDLVQGLIAGGEKAIRNSIENAEDSKEEAAAHLQDINFTKNDFLVGIAASGSTPYVIGGLEYAKSKGAKTAALSCNPDSKIAEVADVSIAPVVGPEVVTGSTRMKAGTAQKMVLNMLSTATMIKLGKVYKNYMVDLQVKNNKLAERAKNMIMEVSEVSYKKAEKYLKKTDYNVKLAIMMLNSGLEKREAEQELEKYEGRLADAIENNR